MRQLFGKKKEDTLDDGVEISVCGPSGVESPTNPNESQSQNSEPSEQSQVNDKLSPGQVTASQSSDVASAWAVFGDSDSSEDED